MTYDFEELDIGELITMEVRWNDAFHSGQDKPDESSQTESVEMKFFRYDALAEFKLRVSSVERGMIYRVSECCDREPADIYTKSECHACGQSRLISHGKVEEVNIPGRPESEQQTFADISTKLAAEDED